MMCHGTDFYTVGTSVWRVQRVCRAAAGVETPLRRAGWVSAEMGCYQEQRCPLNCNHPGWVLLQIPAAVCHGGWFFYSESIVAEGGWKKKNQSDRMCNSLCLILIHDTEPCSCHSALHLHNICTCLAMTHKCLYARGWRWICNMSLREILLITCRFDWSTIHFATLLRSSSWGLDFGKVESRTCHKCICFNRWSVNYLVYNAACWNMDFSR